MNQPAAPDVIARFVRSALIELRCNWPDTAEDQLAVLRRAQRWFQTSVSEIEGMMIDLEAQLESRVSDDGDDSIGTDAQTLGDDSDD